MRLFLLQAHFHFCSDCGERTVYSVFSSASPREAGIVRESFLTYGCPNWGKKEKDWVASEVARSPQRQICHRGCWHKREVFFRKLPISYKPHKSSNRLVGHWLGGISARILTKRGE